MILGNQAQVKHRPKDNTANRSKSGARIVPKFPSHA
jgi:hypothetical protein